VIDTFPVVANGIAAELLDGDCGGSAADTVTTYGPRATRSLS